MSSLNILLRTAGKNQYSDIHQLDINRESIQLLE